MRFAMDDIVIKWPKRSPSLSFIVNETDNRQENDTSNILGPFEKKEPKSATNLKSILDNLKKEENGGKLEKHGFISFSFKPFYRKK